MGVRSCLFVGGCADGSYVMIDITRDMYEIPDLELLDNFYTSAPPQDSVMMKTSLYKRHVLMIEHKPLYIYGEKSLTSTDIYTRIFAYYGGKKQRDRNARYGSI